MININKKLKIGRKLIFKIILKVNKNIMNGLFYMMKNI